MRLLSKKHLKIKKKNGDFLLDLKVHDNYPFVNQVDITFLTPIYHPAINESGEILPSSITSAENAPSTTIEHKLLTLVSLLYDPKELLPDPLTEPGEHF
jgi:ubiquitin-protein ligase